MIQTVAKAEIIGHKTEQGNLCAAEDGPHNFRQADSVEHPQNKPVQRNPGSKSYHRIGPCPLKQIAEAGAAAAGSENLQFCSGCLHDFDVVQPFPKLCGSAKALSHVSGQFVERFDPAQFNGCQGNTAHLTGINTLVYNRGSENAIRDDKSLKPVQLKLIGSIQHCFMGAVDFPTVEQNQLPHLHNQIKAFFFRLLLIKIRSIHSCLFQTEPSVTAAVPFECRLLPR